MTKRTAGRANTSNRSARPLLDFILTCMRLPQPEAPSNGFEVTTCVEGSDPEPSDWRFKSVRVARIELLDD